MAAPKVRSKKKPTVKSPQTFTKPKSKVGKTKPKPSNYTSTSFAAKSINVRSQSLHSSTPSRDAQLRHALQLLSSKSSQTRKEALSQVLSLLRSATTQQGTAAPSTAPVTSQAQAPQLLDPSLLLAPLLPLILDPSPSIRQLVHKTLSLLAPSSLPLHAPQILLYIHIAMTHLSAEIRADSTGYLSWLLQTCALAGEVWDVVGAGDGLGWRRCLECFWWLCGWEGFVAEARSGAKDGEGGKWGGVGGAVGRGEPRVRAKHLEVLAELLEAGLEEDPGKVTTEEERDGGSQDTDIPIAYYLPHYSLVSQNLLPQKPNPYGYLDLFTPADAGARSTRLGNMDDWGFAGDRESRIQSLVPWREVFVRGIRDARREGGEVGRAVGRLERIVGLIPVVEGGDA